MSEYGVLRVRGKIQLETAIKALEFAGVNSYLQESLRSGMHMYECMSDGNPQDGLVSSIYATEPEEFAEIERQKQELSMSLTLLQIAGEDLETRLAAGALLSLFA